VGQTALIANSVMAQISTLRFISIHELELLLEFLGVSLLWLIISGQIDTVKKAHKLKIPKVIKLLKEHEDHLPVWVLEALASTPYTKNNRKLQVVVKDYM